MDKEFLEQFYEDLAPLIELDPQLSFEEFSSCATEAWQKVHGDD